MQAELTAVGVSCTARGFKKGVADEDERNSPILLQSKASCDTGANATGWESDIGGAGNGRRRPRLAGACRRNPREGRADGLLAIRPRRKRCAQSVVPHKSRGGEHQIFRGVGKVEAP